MGDLSVPVSAAGGRDEQVLQPVAVIVVLVEAFGGALPAVVFRF